MSLPTPPQLPPVFNFSPDHMIKQAEYLLTETERYTDALVQNVTIDQANFSNVILALEHRWPHGGGIIGFIQSVSPDPEIRGASVTARKLIRGHSNKLNMREDVYKLIQAVYDKQRDDPSLDSESRLALEKRYQLGLRLGLTLLSEKREQYQEIKRQMLTLSLDFERNLNEERGGIWLTRDELAGVPNDVLDSLVKGEPGSENEHKLRLTFKYPHLHPTLQYCTNAETRKKVFIANENKCTDNLAILHKVLRLRAESAQLLGYKNHAEFILQFRMANSPETVNNFLDDVESAIQPKVQEELTKLKALKVSEMNAESSEARIYPWDLRYYSSLMLARDLELDQNMITEYFPLQTCLSNMLTIFSESFGLKFIEITGKSRDAISETGRGDDIVWHPDVRLFSAWDEGTDALDRQDFLGYLYMDLHPRDGKYGHACSEAIQEGCTADGHGKRRYPTAVLTCNFTSPTATKPSLLTHREVTTLFHELGHGIHKLVSRTKYERFHGTNVLSDFVEAPSQMLENWCITPSQIKQLSQHWSYLSPEYKTAYMESCTYGNGMQPEEKMPDDMIDTIVRSTRAGAAMKAFRTLSYSLFDAAVHQKSPEEIDELDISKLYNDLYHNVHRLDEHDHADDHLGSHGVAISNHIMGTGSGYYKYLWSEVYSSDMFTLFADDPSNKDIGRRYRRMILEPGGSRDPMELLTEFLGRPPSTDAFYRQLI